jgi:hypothetical protein
MTLETWRHDLGYAWRSLIERPAYAFVVILTLALGIDPAVALRHE